MKNRHGQALIIVVIIIAVIMAVFANSFTTQLRYHAQEETEIYQREQALYLAEMGINQMIFNINNGTTYNDGDTITRNFSGIGNYTATYHTPDDSGFDGSSYIESVGTVGEISRKVFASVQSGSGSRDAFKYCLYTTPGGTSDGAFLLLNFVYPPYYLSYNYAPGLLPIPNMQAYENDADIAINDPAGDTLHVDNSYNNKVVYVHMDSLDTLTVDFSGMKKKSIAMSLITDANSVYVTGLNNRNWTFDKKQGVNYPLIVHSGAGSFEIAEDSGDLTGFMYTQGYFVLDSMLTAIYGEVMEDKPGGYLDWVEIVYYYIDNHNNTYYTTPPPHFIIGDVTKVLPGSFREEY
jgi:type II secretory pathway pseudopilin PulG